MTRRRCLSPFVQQIISTQPRIHNSWATIPVSPQKNALSTIHRRILTRATTQNALFFQVAKRTLATNIHRLHQIRMGVAPRTLSFAVFAKEPAIGARPLATPHGVRMIPIHVKK